jgi:hypothetical protein
MPGVFWPAALKTPSAAANVRQTDDATLLFRAIGAGGATFQNLVGNVAELVCDEADELDIQPDRKSPEGVRKFSATHTGSIAVIGGSALSAPELELFKSYPVNSVAEPYADVGVRLAFSAPAHTIAERLKWSLDEQQYLPAAIARAEK